MQQKFLRISSTVLVCAYFLYYAMTYTAWHFIDGADLIFHEAGHTIFFFFGECIQIAAGSGFQIALPLAIALYFFFTKKYVSGSLCLLWIGQNILNVSVYAADAIKMQLDLLGGDGVIHDWNYLLSSLGILRYTAHIAQAIYMLGMSVIFAGSVFAVYYAWTGTSENV